MFVTVGAFAEHLMHIHVLMRDEKEERKKQARSNKQTRQSNTAHTCTYIGIIMYMQLCKNPPKTSNYSRSYGKFPFRSVCIARRTVIKR